MIKEFRLAELVAVMHQAPLLTAHLVPTKCDHGMHFSAGLEHLLSHLCGEVSEVEMGFAIPVVQRELVRQHPWLLGIASPKPDSWVWLWAWLDTMEIKHGVVHHVEPLPAAWRSSVKLSSYSIPGLNLVTGESMTITWQELPEELQFHLRSLGYDETA
jgi:hypothetical protein